MHSVLALNTKQGKILPANSYNQGSTRIGEEMAAGYTPYRAQRTFLKKGLNGLRLHAGVGCLRVVAAWERFPSKQSRRYQSRKKRPGASRCLGDSTGLPEGMPSRSELK